jgi:hypothetical protein
LVISLIVPPILEHPAMPHPFNAQNVTVTESTLVDVGGNINNYDYNQYQISESVENVHSVEVLAITLILT